MSPETDTELDERTALGKPIHRSHWPHEHGLCGDVRNGRPSKRGEPLSCADCVERDESGVCSCGEFLPWR